jgi:predicted Fe-S protein YdhL (DUF1289 family)
MNQAHISCIHSGDTLHSPASFCVLDHPLAMLDRPVKTPCIGVCSTGIGDSVCRGCKRFSHEVIDWNSYTLEQKRIIDARLSGFLSQCVSNKLQVNDPALLKWQLEVQQIPFTAHHDEYCWVFILLKAGAGQIDHTNDFGFEVDLRYRDLSLAALRECIDQEFFILSQAHYERYMLAPDLFREGAGTE